MACPTMQWTAVSLRVLIYAVEEGIAGRKNEQNGLQRISSA